VLQEPSALYSYFEIQKQMWTYAVTCRAECFRLLAGRGTNICHEVWSLSTVIPQKLHDLYWWLDGGGWWTERQWDRRDRRNCMICTGDWIVVGGELKDSGTDGTRETAWFVLVTGWWWVVNWKTVRQMGQKKRTGVITDTHKISFGNPERKRHIGRSRPRWNDKHNVMNWT
jgi:hypothetical protein